MSKRASIPSYQELQRRLAVAEPIVEALKRHEVDAVVGEEKIAFLLLRGVEEVLLSSEAAFHALFMLRGIGVIQADTPTLRFTSANSKACEILGYSESELRTKTYIGLTHPLDRSKDLTALSRVLRGAADSWTIEKRCVRKDGRVVRVVVNSVALRDDAGQAVKILAMIGEIAPHTRARRKAAAPKRPSKASRKPRRGKL